MTGDRAKDPEVSVVIPTHNRAGLLPETARSVLAQEGVSLELLVVDDGSSDGTEEALRSIADTRLRYLRLERQSGPAAARNRGVEDAKGHWIAFLDDDDRWASEKLRRQLDAAEGTGAEWAWCGAKAVDENRRELGTESAPGAEELREKLKRENAVPAGASNVIATAAAMRQVGPFDVQIPALSDWDMWIRLAESVPGAPCDEVLVEFVIHPAGMSLVSTDAGKAEFGRFLLKHPEVDARRHVDWIAKAHWDAGRRWSAVRDWLVGRWRYWRRRLF
jgi:glycosyltransferase involved in cell wall biosynthesis